MTMPTLPPDPYEPPAAAATHPRRPTGLAVVCVIAIILGGLGLAGSLVGIVGLTAGSSMQRAFTLPLQPGMDRRVIDAQLAMQRNIQAVADRYWGYNLAFVLACLFVAGGLLAGGIITLGIKPAGRRLLIGAFAVAVVFEVLRAVFHVFMQIEMAAVMSDSMSRIMEATSPAGAPGADQAATIAAVATQVGVFVGIAFTCVYVLAKLIFYAVGIHYLRRPNVQRLFGQTEATTSAPGAAFSA